MFSCGHVQYIRALPLLVTGFLPHPVAAFERGLNYHPPRVFHEFLLCQDTVDVDSVPFDAVVNQTCRPSLYLRTVITYVPLLSLSPPQQMIAGSRPVSKYRIFEQEKGLANMAKTL